MLFAQLPLALALCSALVGCSGLGDEAYQRSAQRDWNRLATTDYPNMFRQLTGMNKLLPSQREREAVIELELCNHPNGQNRIISQNGIDDHVAYRRCAATPYPSATGLRLKQRPNG